MAHSIFNIPGMLYQAEVLSSVIVIEAILAHFAVIAFMYIKKSRKIFGDLVLQIRKHLMLNYCVE
ncbi:hypothetical protein AJ85_19875 [Alkalihalobacillus alcalophilus ATCC 27647 = CGMCC 1.3604]|uniref:Uncharacterized protein n=1 Tax=Alkalihalobacillus alcalophilus ATCC 27647 = CGMCC 1.3604 TaxID=1218173 RepID=A0A4S4JVA1_ALKAL|nr:hypothetical protein AJ85_19875 [Alkalihalobacillus alcalophilus ATCC 27647 = CGMCC 1.3604]